MAVLRIKKDEAIQQAAGKKHGTEMWTGAVGNCMVIPHYGYNCMVIPHSARSVLPPALSQDVLSVLNLLLTTAETIGRVLFIFFFVVSELLIGIA